MYKVGAMKTERPIQEIARLFLGMVIVAAVSIAIISTLRGPAPASATAAASSSPTSSPQPPATLTQATTTEAAYPGPGGAAVPPGPASRTPVPYFVQMLRTYQEALKGKNLSEEGRQSLETKVAMYGRMATQWAIYEKTTPIPHTFVPRHLPTATFPVGLREGGTSDFHTWEAIIHNIWSQYVNNNEYIVVYAGELGYGTDYPGRGVVFVLRETGQGRGGHTNEYLLPEGIGWVRISEIKGDYLVLTSKEGKTFYFYVPGQQLVPSLTDVAPTVTPLPTSRPLPTIGPPPTKTLSPYPYPGP
jgi:hypothetical protein